MLNSTALAKPGKVVQANPAHNDDGSKADGRSKREANGAAQAALNPSPKRSRSSNFWTKPPFSEIEDLVNKAPNGILAKEIEALTGSKANTERLAQKTACSRSNRT